LAIFFICDQARFEDVLNWFDDMADQVDLSAGTFGWSLCWTTTYAMPPPVQIPGACDASIHQSFLPYQAMGKDERASRRLLVLTLRDPRVIERNNTLPGVMKDPVMGKKSFPCHASFH
jgi:hypothetical protein